MGHVGGVKYAYNKAFTLSEVLITLVVIGIVAAVTIPSISKASQKYILKNQFKKTYSTIMNAINKSDADLGGNTLCYYPFGQYSSQKTSDCSAFFAQMISNLNIIKSCLGNAKTDGCLPSDYMKNHTAEGGANIFYPDAIANTDYVYILSDGSLIIRAPSTNPLFLVDINGQKGPNEMGKDVYRFDIESDDGSSLKIRNYIIENPYKPTAYFKKLSDIYKE